MTKSQCKTLMCLPEVQPNWVGQTLSADGRGLEEEGRRGLRGVGCCIPRLIELNPPQRLSFGKFSPLPEYVPLIDCISLSFFDRINGGCFS